LRIDQVSCGTSKASRPVSGKALNDGDYQSAKEYVSEDIEHIGTLGSRHGATPYLDEIDHLHLKFHIEQILAEEDDVCVMYDLKTSGITISACGWFKVKADKVISLRVAFDPRAVL
jgi:hypothetical protein